MVNPVVIAYLVDLIASFLAQMGLMMQKLAHKHQEKQSVHGNGKQSDFDSKIVGNKDV